MVGFNELLAQCTARDSNYIPGCVLSAIDDKGHKFYSKCSGYDSVAPNASQLNPNNLFWMASCTKLIGTIAALQCVERGQISLDDHVEHVLPELANLEIIQPSGSSDASGRPLFTLRPSTKKITLRHLLSHTSGLSYDVQNSLTAAWRASRQMELLGMSGKVTEAYVVPLLFEPGESWEYSGGIDLAGEIVSRLNNVSLEEYLREHVFGPLGMNSSTFHLELYPELTKRLVKMTKRTESGILSESKGLWPDSVPEDCGGAGLYSSPDDYIKILSDLLRETPMLLKSETVDLMFSPQLKRGSLALRALHDSWMTKGMTAIEQPSVEINFGLGGIYVERDVGNYKRDSLVWGGLPNLFWFANRSNRVAGLYASQVIPPGDPKSVHLAQEFIKDVYQSKQL
ncbi:beta-lactamase/transpeptidase-like protein [Paraphoma chrysanthemicola]|uniref:Beta-lactamase/transpeptidase-like protein n=1 Tax=Paraphoma chrysanthemicola TaxID=798071 RepID=A0A8K0VXQ9_9PLEO|nr:beta-lactamase/transpeptidase-like protein [Paraphoma chrysanthemicola]